ncbi:hypothetical protein COCOBI_12-5480 [Coccomyxa sp. Obi]|nr:hypothetical protein COCOBI_12-5480 [Coccomyxa sp. Obi]
MASRRGRGRRSRGGGRLGGTIPSMFRSNKSGRGRSRPKGVPACERLFQRDAAAPSATQDQEIQPSAPHGRQQCGSSFHQVTSIAVGSAGAAATAVEEPRGLQRSAATEEAGHSAGGSRLPTVLKEESNGGHAESLQRSAAADVRKRRKRARLVLLEDSEVKAPVEGSGGLQQPSASDDIWLCSEDDNDESEELVPEEETCWRPSATAQVARQTINGLGSTAANAAAGGKGIAGTQGTGLEQRAAAEASGQAASDRAALASPATVFIKEEPVAEACRQAAEHKGPCQVPDGTDRCYKPLLLRKELKRRREQTAAVEVPMQGLSTSSLSAGLASIPATGKTPHEAAGGVSDVNRGAASVVGALRLMQACRPPQITAEAMEAVRETGGGRSVMEPAGRKAATAEEPSTGLPDRAAAGPPDQEAAEAPELAPSGLPDLAAAGLPDQAVADAPEQEPGGSRAAASSAGASVPDARPLHRKRLTARRTTGGARPPTPAPRVAAPAPCASPQQLDVKVVAARSDEDIDDELVDEIYSEEVHAMLQQALFDRSRKRNPKIGLELLPLSYSTIPGKAAQRTAEEAVQAYFALTAEEKRAYMKSRVEVFEILATFTDHPAQRFNVATMSHLDPDRQVERGLRAVQDMPAFTLMGEYCGVVKTGDAAEAASAEDPMGFGGLKNDKLKDFCHSHPDRNGCGRGHGAAGLWSEDMELVVDPCRAGNVLRYINDYQGMPGGITKNVATVEVFDHDTLRPHIFFFTIQAVSAGEELLMDYGEQFRRFIKSEGNRAKSLVAARKAAAEARREVEAANAKAAAAMEEVLQARDVVQMALQEAEDAHTEAKLAKKEARKAKREKAELENLLKKHGIKH